jgi:hypothetical protein
LVKLAHVGFEEKTEKLNNLIDKTRTVDIDRLLERVAAKSLDKVRPTKGEFNQDINPEKIQEKLLERYSIIFI